MRRFATVAAVGLGFLLVGTSEAEAQLFNFPQYANPSATGMPATYLAGTYGRGLNDNSGKLNAYGVAAGRTGIANRVTVGVGGGIIDLPVDNEITLGGTVSVDVLPPDAGANVAIQGGIGWMNQTILTTDVTLLHFPVGVSLSTNIEGSSANVRPWVMPRVSFNRASNGTSNTETDFGASGGVSVTLPAGLGIHTALDILASDFEAWLFGIGVHYVIY